jgi:large subunit ribosomal protein L32e
MSKGFVRTDTFRYHKLGRKKRALQRWRRPKGRDNKMRLSRRSYPNIVSVGFKSARKDTGKIKGLYPVLITNFFDLERIDKKSIAIISRRIGAKKKIEILKRAAEMKIKILNAKSGEEK